MDKMVNMENHFEGIYRGKRVLVTGHTGFKGSWLSILLHRLGAEVFGYALKPHTNPSLYELAEVDQIISSTFADIRDFDKLNHSIKQIRPDIIIHLAAQALVRESYRNPRETYETNVMGTVNLLDAVRKIQGVRAVLIVTSDKCYENKEWHWAYRENETIGGYDPYSNSKGCVELVTSAFRNSYFYPEDYAKHGVAIASARAGNVIGGGDWAEDRLIPDFIRSICNGEKVKIRSPYAIRPWQHVLEPLSGYLALCAKLYTEGPRYSEGWNFGPEDSDAKSVQWITDTISKEWGEGASFEIDNNPQPHEASYLKLDISKAKAELNWYPKWGLEKTLLSIVKWTKAYIRKDNMHEECVKQVEEYFQTR